MVYIALLEISHCPLARHRLHLLGASTDSLGRLPGNLPPALDNMKFQKIILFHIFLKVLQVHYHVMNNQTLQCCQLKTTKRSKTMNLHGFEYVLDANATLFFHSDT